MPWNLGFTDITAAMGGAKVNVNRTYNSSNKAKGDFGYGWSLGVQGMTLSENTPLSNGYELLVGGSGLHQVTHWSRQKIMIS